MSNSSNFNLSCVWTGLHFKRNLTELSYLTFQPVLTVQTGQLLFSTSFWARIGCHWSQLAAQRSQSELEVTLAITLNGDLFCLTRSLAAPGTAKIVTVWEVRCTKNYSLASRPAFRRVTSIRSAKPSATPSSSASDPFWFESFEIVFICTVCKPAQYFTQWWVDCSVISFVLKSVLGCTAMDSKV